MTDAIVTRGLCKRFGPKPAVENLDLAIPAGCLCGFIGPNGAGKTTTIRMIMSIIFPDSGELSVLGRNSAVESKDRIGYLPEERGVYRKMRVLPFLEYMGRLKGVDASVARARAGEWLARMNLSDARRKKCEELSKGMQQKVQFIAAVLHEPELLILDEVFSGLDPVNRRLMRDLIAEQHREGRTILFSTHAMYEAEQLCERVVMIHRGRKVLDGTIDEVRGRFDARTVIAEPVRRGGAAERIDLSRWAGLIGVQSASEERDGLHLKLIDRADPRAVMQAALMESPLRRVEIKRVSLEDVFIAVVEASGERVTFGEQDAEAGEYAVAAHGGGES